MVIQNHQDAEELPKTLQTSPTILIIDSGVGGLSVYSEVVKLLPMAHYLYVFDNDGFPYGTKEEAFIIERVMTITQQMVQRYDIHLAIIACNTASTITLPSLRKAFNFPVIGVVPAIKPAARLTSNGVVGLLATQGTIQREYTYELIKQFAEGCQIEMLAAPLLVELAERKLHGLAVAVQDVEVAISSLLTLNEVPDTVILGCTHFPLLKHELEQIFPRGTLFIDSGLAIARRALFLLQDIDIEQKNEPTNKAFYTRDDEKISALLPVLKQYGFEKLENLINNNRSD